MIHSLLYSFDSDICFGDRRFRTVAFPLEPREVLSTLRAAVVGLTVMVLLTTPAQAQRAVVPDNDIAKTLISQFDKFDLVGLGELHGSLADQELRIRLVRNKDFARKVHNIVVEGLNSLYQDDLDRFIKGDDVPQERLQRVWRDTTQIFAGPVMRTAYEQFLKEVRLANQSAPDSLKVRVFAGDPPINWANVRSHEEFMSFLRNRVDFGAEVIAREILRKQQKALLIFGQGHFTRNQQMKTPHGFIPLTPTIGWLLDRDFPGRLYVITPIRGALYPDTPKLERLIGRAKLPVLLKLKGTAFGALDPNEFIPAHPSLLLGAPPPPFHPFRDGIGMSDVADACIYRGRVADVLVTPDPVYVADKAYAAELERRARLAH
ncbi:MAG: hypothetical protein ACR2NN_06725 [Bryobacteraceae bacterium]